MNFDIITAFRNEMASKGIIYSGEIKPDTNRIERFDVDEDKRGSLKGYYTLHTDGIPAGIFGAWDKNGKDYFTWSGKSFNEMTSHEKRAYAQKTAKLKRLREEEKQKRQEDAKKSAQLRWDNAQLVINHDYLNEKKVCSHNLRYDFKESNVYPTLLIPLHDTNGEIQTLQRIHWSEENKKFVKKFLLGGAIQGNYFLFGEILPSTNHILICEGWATGATLFEASAFPTICSLSSSNLCNVALNIHKKYPHHSILICGDDDCWPDEDGKMKGNAGKQSAIKAAALVNADTVFPKFTTLNHSYDQLAVLKPTDFNDILSKIYVNESKIAALKEVKNQLNSYTKANYNTKSPKNFTISNEGIFFIKEDKEGNFEQIFICSKIEVIAYLRDVNSTNWGRVLKFKDPSGYEHAWGMPMSMLKGNGDDVRGQLLYRGVSLAHGGFAKGKFLEFIMHSIPSVYSRCVGRLGWYRENNNRVFVFPDRTIGTSTEQIIYQTDTLDTSFRTKGSLNEWKDHISKYCVGNSRLILAVSCSFAAIMLDFTNEESGGINYFGQSSTGKTTALHIAASVFGDSTYLSRWRSTVNGLEALASSRNDCLLILDELAQIDPKEAGNAIYTLANGTGKVRANQSGGSRVRNEWRILFLSSGEIDLNQHIGEGGKKATAGQQVRCIDIYSDAKKGFGIFEELHDFPSGNIFSNYLKEKSMLYYGSPARSFIEIILKLGEPITIQNKIKEIQKNFISAISIDNVDGQVKRVAERFSLIACAGELATEFGITGWDKNEALNAAKICFDVWLSHRGGTQCTEENALLAQVKRVIESFSDSHFQNFHDSQHEPLRERFGFKEIIKEEVLGEISYKYYVLSNGFKELHKGYSQSFAKTTLNKIGWLEINDENEANISVYIPALGKRARCYILNDKMWEYQ